MIHHAHDDKLLQLQLDKLEEMKKEGINPFGKKFERTGLSADYVNHFEEGKEVRIAGRITAARDMGKSKFWDLTDISGRVQLFMHPKAMEEASYALLSRLNVGDLIGISGSMFKTKTGENSVLVKQLELLAKALRPLPEKYHGLKDVENRFRQRYLDLVMNPDVRDIFFKRSKIVQTIRKTLDGSGFLEVETPMLQSLSGGAVAKPFMTHHNALDMDLFLRIAPELYLKRLLVGGMEKVYEINRSFRNEGLSRRHNPEFTMLEVYSAYDNYIDMMNLCELLIQSSAQACGVTGESTLPSGKTANLLAPFKRIKLFDAVKEYSGLALKEWADIRGIAKELKIEHCETLDEGFLLQEFFERYVEEKLIEPTFVTHLPSVLCPLAKKSLEDPRFSDRFEIFIDGQEVGNAYSELNDPVEQLKRFQEQLENTKEEDGVSRSIDMDFVRALEHGMPPAGGLGIGIDRMVMMITGAPSIREVILFPLLRPEEE